MDKRLVFIPEGMVSKVDALEFGLDSTVGEIDSLMCNGYFGTLDTSILEVLLAHLKIRVIPGERAIVGSVVFEVARGECDQYIQASERHPSPEKFDAVSEDLADTLAEFGSRLGLREVGLHFISAPRDYSPPRKNSLKHLTIVVGGGPVGLINSQTVSTLCGVRLEESGGPQMIRSHSSGYGGIVKDDQDSIIAQIVDSVIYLTIPSDDSRFVTRFSNEGAGLFKKILYMAWNRRDTASPPIVRTSLESEDEFVAQMLQYDRECIRAYEKMLDAARSDLERIENKLGDQIIHVRNLDQICAGIKERMKIPDRLEKLRAGYLKLKAHHLLDQIMVTDDEFFEIWTKPVFVEHEGNTYGPLGPYVITIVRASGIIIRCRDVPHENMYVHPHVPVNTSMPCLGNATRAIESALVSEESRPVGIELVLEWLENGYDHGIAETKITCWPKVTTESNIEREVAGATG